LPDESAKHTVLPCEETILKLGQHIDTLTCLAEDESAVQVEGLQANHARIKAEYGRHLSAWDIVQMARHPDRPGTLDYIDMIVTDFRELHGDRLFGDDPALITGFGRIGTRKALLVGHNKGRTLAQRKRCNFGSAHPEGYRKALLKMKLAEKFGVPVVCLIDTPGAHPGAQSEERGQAQAIAVNLRDMSRLHVPVVCVIVGEGASGGALGIGVGDRVAIMQYAYCSVISPEGCAAILWGNRTQVPAAAAALKLTGPPLQQTGYIDTIIPEPTGGAHRSRHTAAHNLRVYLVNTLRELEKLEISHLLRRRYEKLSRIGRDAVHRGSE
jgi:acetyl-CoA carboxylase carboxyl transferase subunit alpha